MRKTISHVTVALLAAAVAYALGQSGSPRPVVIEPAVNAQPAPAVPRAAPEAAAAGRPALPAQPDLSPEEADNVGVYQKVNRSVVHITTRGVLLDDFLMIAAPRAGTGSGSILDKQGHILTNNHVVEDARQVHVGLADGSDYQAKLIGTDPVSDLAVIKIDAPAEKLVPVPWGDSAKLLVGMRVFAIGNPFGLERTLTTGIVSSLNRSLRMESGRYLRGLIQTDAAINPGSSGGPLLNRKGEIVGITTAIVSRAGQSSGVGMAVPVGTARHVVEQLIKHGKVIRADSGILNVWQTEQGLRIARLAPNGPAAQAGLREPEEVVLRQGPFICRRPGSLPGRRHRRRGRQTGQERGRPADPDRKQETRRVSDPDRPPRRGTQADQD